MDARDLNDENLDKHFYYAGKHTLVESLMKKANVPANAKILDVGCGTGSDLKILEKFGDVTVLDIDQPSLDMIDEKYDKICADLTKVDLPTEKFDIVIAFDVLEHVEDHAKAAKNLQNSLKKGGKFIGSVPAYQFLYSRHDELLAHFRRYTRSSFNKLIEETGLQKKSSGYWMSILFPVAAMIRLMKKQTHEQQTDIQTLPKPINSIFAGILKLEAILGTSKFFRFPFGLTTWCIAEKK